MKKVITICFAALCLLLFSTFSFGETIFFQENFDDANFSSRGWYDITGGTISTTEHIPGSTGSLECRFLLGGLGCNGKNPGRHKFTPSNSVYVSYWVKHSSNWVGSGTTKTYHPHVIYLLTTENGDWDGLAYDHLTAYIEENRGYPYLAIQDGQNIDESRIGVDLTNITENRAVAGCNGTPPNMGQERVDCYLSGSVHWNGTGWRGTTPYFFDAIEKTEWHFVEAYFQLNTIVNGVGQQNGIVRYWYDGQLVIDHSNVILRTGEYPNMQFNQLIIGPWIGDGSPLDQTFWIDNMTIANERPGSSDMFIINASAGPGGAINPSGSFNAEAGSILTLTVTPNAGFQVSSVTGCDGRLVGDKYITAPITANCSVFATFSPIPNLLSSSTFNCPEWTQDGSTITCDGVNNDHITTYCKDGSGNVPALINSAGNNPSGAGGNGFRVPIGDGSNINGGTPTVNLDTPQSELWIRFYLRYPLGFTWSPLQYHKLIYISQSAAVNTAIVDMYNGGSASEVSLYIQSWGGIWHNPDHRYEPADPSYVVPNWGWDQIMGGPQGDGKWHFYESHFKINSAPGVPDGIYQQWVDGRLVNNHRDVEWNASPFTRFAFSTNQNSPANGHCVYVDWDDIAISTTGYIGPVPSPSGQYVVTATAGSGGSISPSGAVFVNSGATQTFTVLPDSGYHIESVTGCGGELNDTIYTTAPVTSDCTVSALYAPNSTAQYTVTGIAIGSGTIAPASQIVASGSTAMLTVTPDAGYHIVSVTGCNGNLDGSTYTTGVITADCTVTATFAVNGGTSPALLWSTTYDCADWNTYNDPLTCDGLSKGGTGACNQGGTFYEQITAAANNPLGNGGKGQRRWKGDGVNVNSGGTVMYFDTPRSEIWVRWYMRYQPGFKWNPLYTDGLIAVDNNTIIGFYDWDRLNVFAVGENHRSTTGGWDTIMQNGAIDPDTGHRASDGQFHYFEVHLKNDGPNGIAEFWADGVQYLSYNNINFGTDFTRFYIGSGQNSPANGGCYYVDYDDIAISTTGHIGPLYTISASAGAGGTISPSGTIKVNSGATLEFLVTPDVGYQISSVTGCNGSLDGNVYSAGPITGDCTITAVFAAIQYAVSGVAVGSGIIAPSSQSISHGNTASFTVEPSTGNHIQSITGCGTGTLAGNSYTTAPITADCTVTATFAIDSGTPSALLWSTTFNCGEWNSGLGQPSCDGIFKAGDWTCDQGGTFYEQITSSANNSTGTGGKGQRHWTGDNSTGSGGLAVMLDAPEKELWIRWYMRFQPGFKWSYLNYGIVFYLSTTADTQAVPEWYGPDGFRIVGSGTNARCDNCGWTTLFPSGQSDGSWHYFETHFKMDTNGSNGVAELWVDGVKKITATNMNFGTQSGWVRLGVGGGNATPSNGICSYIDFDDFAVSDTGYIGPITTGPYTISISTGSSGGSILQTVPTGSNQTFTIQPDPGYHIVDVKVDGDSRGAITTYTFTDIRANHSITTNFATP